MASLHVLTSLSLHGTLCAMCNRRNSELRRGSVLRLRGLGVLDFGSSRAGIQELENTSEALMRDVACLGTSPLHHNSVVVSLPSIRRVEPLSCQHLTSYDRVTMLVYSPFFLFAVLDLSTIIFHRPVVSLFVAHISCLTSR